MRKRARLREKWGTTMIDLDELIADARHEESIQDKLGDGFSEGSEERAFYYEHRDRYKCLADALEAVRAERDAALARIADLEAELEVAMRPHSECERSGAEAGERIVDLEGDMARVEARIAEAAELHQPEVIGVHEGQGAEVWCPHCETYWPCQTAVALGLNEGENDD